MVLALPAPRALANVNPYAARIRARTVAYWPLNEASGVAADRYNRLPLTDNNSVGAVAGPSPLLPRARSFVSASSQSLSHADSAYLPVGQQEFQFSAFVKITAFGSGGVIGGQYLTTGNQRAWRFLHEDQGGGYAFELWISPDGTSGATVNVIASNAYGVGLNQWLAVRGGYVPAAGIMFAQVGTLAKVTAAYTGGIFNSTGDFLIGAQGVGASGLADAHICEARLCNSVMTDAEWAWYVNNTQGRRMAA